MPEKRNPKLSNTPGPAVRVARVDCAACKIRSCSKPGGGSRPVACPMESMPQVLSRAMAAYDQSLIRRLYVAAARTEARGYCEWPRVREIAEFAKSAGLVRLGLAFCIGLAPEAAMATEIFASHGLEVYSVSCSAGGIPKEEFGVADGDKLHPGQWENGCNPIGQAALLASCETKLNVILGLCVGHDTLFIMHSEAPVTILAAKDRVTGHDPVSALHGAHGYFRKRVFGNQK